MFNGSLEKPKLTALTLTANHPTALGAADLVSLNNGELKKRAQELGADTTGIDKKVNAQLRQAIRDKVNNLEIATMNVSLLEGNGANFWKGMQAVMPTFAVFKSDRPSTDQDPEAQDPLNTAVKEAVKQKETELNVIAAYIEDQVKRTADLTLQKLKEMDPSLATTLSPQFPTPKWSSLFKASITGDQDIPINKRGSGVRRLILLNFFRARAEQLTKDGKKENAIYAIEEPETSQHPRNQRLLISALQALAGRDQVIITTHTPVLARVIPATAIRFIDSTATGQRTVQPGGDEATNELIARSLGVLPDHTVKIFIGVEGKHDIPFLKHMSRILLDSGETAPDLEQLETEGEIIFTPFGGSNLALWSNRLKNLNRPEFHIYDRDTTPPATPRYQEYINIVNARPDCEAYSTSKREVENYLHHDAINLALAEAGIALTLTAPFNDTDDVPTLLATQVNAVAPQSNKWNDKRAKEFLCNKVAAKMTRAMLDEIDPQGDVRGWFRCMQAMLVAVNVTPRTATARP